MTLVLNLQDKEGELFPKDDNEKLLYQSVDHVDTWRAMEKCVEKGLIRSIGLSNFNSKQIQHVLDNCTIKPVINQVDNWLSMTHLFFLNKLHY